jgi:hypothetical protein
MDDRQSPLQRLNADITTVKRKRQVFIRGTVHGTTSPSRWYPVAPLSFITPIGDSRMDSQLMLFDNVPLEDGLTVHRRHVFGSISHYPASGTVKLVDGEAYVETTPGFLEKTQGWFGSAAEADRDLARRLEEKGRELIHQAEAIRRRANG